MKRFPFLPRSFFFLVTFLAVDFGSRQVYLFFKKARDFAHPAVPVEKPLSPKPKQAAGDLRLLGATEDGAHHYYHHGLPASGVKFETWRGKKYTRFTNRLGFRDAQIRDVSLKKKMPRMILMGDSNIYGVGLEWDQTLAGLLAKKFPSVEILNAAVPSYCPTIEEAKLRYLMGRYGLEADAVVLFLDVADIDDELSFSRNPDGSIHLHGPQFSELPKSKNWADNAEKILQKRVEGNFTVTGAVVRNGRQWIRRHCAWFGLMAYEKGRWAEYDGHLNARIDEGILRAASALARLNEFLKSKNTRLIVVVSPGSSQMDLLDPRSRALTVWESWGRANQVPVVSLFQLFYRHALDYPELIQSSGHWNEKGQALVAGEMIQQLVVNLPWLSPTP